MIKLTVNAPARMHHRFPRALAIALAVLAGALLPAAPASPEKRPDPTLRQELNRGHEFLEKRYSEGAVKAFKNANKLADGRSVEALIGLARAYTQLGRYADAEKSARRALENTDDDGVEMQAQNLLGIALFRQAGDSPKRLAAAEAAFRAALELSGEPVGVVKVNLAEVLLKLGRHEEGLTLLHEYLETDPAGPNADHARSLANNPRRAGENVVPEFSLVTLEGESLTPGDFLGKVVLLEFWGTWCVPCHYATPYLQRLSRRLEGKPFVLIGIATDSDRATLESYLEKNEVTWPQMLDDRRMVTRDAFHVSRFPTFIVIDHEGVVVFRHSGWGNRISGQIDREVGRAVSKAVKARKRAEAD